VVEGAGAGDDIVWAVVGGIGGGWKRLEEGLGEWKGKGLRGLMGVYIGVEWSVGG